MEVSTARYLKALQDINGALTTGLQTAISALENFDKFTEEQRNFIIDKMRELVESSHNVYGPEPTKH